MDKKAVRTLIVFLSVGASTWLIHPWWAGLACGMLIAEAAKRAFSLE
jgi:hypothetical protein